MKFWSATINEETVGQCNAHTLKLLDGVPVRCQLSYGHAGNHVAFKYDGANRGAWSTDESFVLTTFIGVVRRPDSITGL